MSEKVRERKTALSLPSSHAILHAFSGSVVPLSPLNRLIRQLFTCTSVTEEYSDKIKLWCVAVYRAIWTQGLQMANPVLYYNVQSDSMQANRPDYLYGVGRFQHGKSISKIRKSWRINRFIKSDGLFIQNKSRSIFTLRRIICLTRIIQRIIRL